MTTPTETLLPSAGPARQHPAPPARPQPLRTPADDTQAALLSMAIEVDPLPPERLLALGAEPAAAFIAPGGDAWVGLGAARWLGPGADAVARLWSTLHDDSPSAPPPVALGALPYRADELPDALWQGLLPAGLMLPERLYIQQGGRAWWRLTLPADQAGTLRGRMAQQRAVLAALAADETLPLAAAVPLAEDDGPGRYAQAVTQAVERIRRGELVKVVLARRRAVVFDAPPVPAAVLHRLGQSHPDCVRYAWQRGGKSWLGATPETLVRLDGRQLRTEALAGTRPAGRAAELLASAKDLHEHTIVVDALRRAIAPLVQRLPVTQPPVVRALRGLAHLHTAIEATLHDRVDFLRLVQALHPTPAVCGLPAANAAALLAALERDPRGLYAGPFVRLSARGDGHAVVSLRGVVLDGRLAVFPAGAGIVDGSEGEAELAETRLKQQVVLDALCCTA
ncbi:MAG: isochorismate synthase [Rubrivivax sp.]|nr:isochorismate synthase [Rubrivivax sp.]